VVTVVIRRLSFPNAPLRYFTNLNRKAENQQCNGRVTVNGRVRAKQNGVGSPPLYRSAPS
jgi:hypothetical protein